VRPSFRLGGSQIQIGDAQRVFLDEFMPRLDDIAHELDEDVVSAMPPASGWFWTTIDGLPGM
jgi:hypothetical protein